METDVAALASRLTAAMTEAFDPDEFDVVLDTDGELNISMDEWTLHLEGWPSGPAWLAIDDEPDDPARYRAALAAALPEPVIDLLRRIDQETRGGLSRALRNGADPFSHSLAEALGHLPDAAEKTLPHST